MTSITKLLIANRGEIASRVIRSARELDIATVAVYSEPDSGAPFVREADESVPLPGSSPADTYLRSDLLVEAAMATGADAVHPGYGFLSERAEFARACTGAGLVFVGPPAEVIEVMGSKTSAKERMAGAGVPVLPGIVIDNDADVGTDFSSRAELAIGFPLLVKAVFGGGGRGMRVVRTPSDLVEAVGSARREARTAFGDGSVFLERFVDTPRHIEVQILGDTQGTVVSLFERECSIQRRYQKVIEEAPSPIVDEALRSELCAAAIAAGSAIGYVGAGTVEFVLDVERRFYFLEVNTRLQVEHPVTEMVTGLDLVHLQLTIAEGRPLPAEVLNARITGHAIEVRLYAEDVDAGFLPSAGVFHRFDIPRSTGVRVDAGVEDGSVVSVHYDPMLAKVIAHGRDRDQARRRLARALHEARIHGVPTNRDLLVGILREPEFADGNIDTGYLDRHHPAELQAEGGNRQLGPMHALAAALAGQAERRAAAPVLSTLPSGWRNVRSGPQHTQFSSNGTTIDLHYRLTHHGLTASVGGEAFGQLQLHSATTDHVEFAADGVRRGFHVRRVDSDYYVDSPLGSTILVELPRFPEVSALSEPGSLLAPMPGTVVRVRVDDGSPVSAGDVILVLEAMKMEHSIAAPHDGTVDEIRVVEGQTVDVGVVLAVVRREQSELSE
jgi:acetyl/propionyl-CoA carboxylase alpha subunit